MITILAQKRYDGIHALWAASEILSRKPKAVCLELPSEFQPIIRKYDSGKLKAEGMASAFSKLLGKKIKVDRKIISNLKKGKRKDLATEGAFIYPIIAAKEVRAKIFAVDAPLVYVQEKVRPLIPLGFEGQIRAVNRARKALVEPDAGLRLFSELINSPFHFFEMMLGHNAMQDPFTHPQDCLVCKVGVGWERFWHSLYAHFVSVIYPVRESKYVTALYYFDRVRESEIAKGIRGASQFGDTLAVLHVWHAYSVQKKLGKHSLETKVLT